MKAEMTEIVMPNDTNHFGTCFGGKIMCWIDMVAAIAAQKAVGSVVTASVDSIEFRRPIKMGDIVTLKASVNRIWDSSMEVGVKVMCMPPATKFSGTMAEYMCLGEPVQACRAYLTFVAVTSQGRRRKIQRFVPEFDCDIRRFEEANVRREIRLANRK